MYQSIHNFKWQLLMKSESEWLWQLWWRIYCQWCCEVCLLLSTSLVAGLCYKNVSHKLKHCVAHFMSCVNRRLPYHWIHTTPCKFIMLQTALWYCHCSNFLLLARYVPNVAKRSVWEQCILRTDRPRILEKFERPYLGNGSCDPLHVWF